MFVGYFVSEFFFASQTTFITPIDDRFYISINIITIISVEDLTNNIVLILYIEFKFRASIVHQIEQPSIQVLTLINE